MNTSRSLFRSSILVAALASLSLASIAAVEPQSGTRRARANVQSVDGGIPAYAKRGEVTGAVRCIGESWPTRLLGHVGDAFGAEHKGVSVDSQGKSADAGLAALRAGSADIVALSRELSASEREAIRRDRGADPVQIAIALEGIEVIVSKQHPLTSLSLADVRSIFRAGPDGGGAAKLWKDVGVNDASLAQKPIKVVVVGSDEGGNSLVAKVLLDGAAFRSDAERLGPTGSPLSNVLTATDGRITYIDPYFRAGAVKAVPVGSSSASAVNLSPATIADGTYPLGRRLYACVAPKAGESMPAQVAEFLRFLVSQQGQRAIAEHGGVPLTARLAEESSRQLR